MFKRPSLLSVFALGLAAIGWIVAGYIGNNLLGTAIALLIGACYLAGAFELLRYRQATATLRQAVEELTEPPAELGRWLERLHPGLRHAVRLRVEGERAALPAPAMTPYLVGLLVLLGMLGTLLGMMATLRGTGTALGSASDLQAIRGSLAAPINGLGFAFGTSIAGVAGSAMLGLLSALVRRERLQAVQALDGTIATSLRLHSQAHRREESFRLLQQQAAAMPALVDRLQEMAAALERHGIAAHERQQADQEAFHRHAEEAYTRLARSVEQSLKDSVADGARTASGVLQPVVASTLARLADESSAIQAGVADAVQRQLDGLATGFDHTARAVTGIWNDALAQHRQANEAHAQAMGEAFARFAETFAQRSTALLDGVAARTDAGAERAAEAWHAALAKQDATHAELAGQADLLVADAADRLLLAHVGVGLLSDGARERLKIYCAERRVHELRVQPLELGVPVIWVLLAQVHAHVEKPVVLPVPEPAHGERLQARWSVQEQLAHATVVGQLERRQLGRGHRCFIGEDQELLGRERRAVLPEGVASRPRSPLVRHVDPVPLVPLRRQLGLLRKNLHARVPQRDRPLHQLGADELGGRRLGQEQVKVRAAGLGTAGDQGELEGADAFLELLQVEGIHVDVDRAEAALGTVVDRADADPERAGKLSVAVLHGDRVTAEVVLEGLNRELLVRRPGLSLDLAGAVRPRVRGHDVAPVHADQAEEAVEELLR